MTNEELRKASGETKVKAVPAVSMETKEMPDTSRQEKAMPDPHVDPKEMPEEGNPEDIVMIDGMRIRIKPTKIKYQRDKTAAFYRVMSAYPLPDILAMERGILDEKRDGDKCVFDWLCAVFDDPKFVIAHYDAMDTQTIETILKIFKRLNAIDEKEEQAKNREAKGTRR